MAEYDLTDRVRDVLRKMVAASRATGADSFLHVATFNGSQVQFGKSGQTQVVGVEAEELAHLAQAGVLTFGGNGSMGSLKRSAFTAVDTGFALPQPPPASVTHNYAGVTVHGDAHGPIAGAAGPHARATQHVMAGDSNLDLIAQLGRATAELIAVVRELVPPDDVGPVVAAAEAAQREASAERPHAGAVAAKGGATVSALLEGMAKVGPAADAAGKLAHAATAVAAWVHAHGAILAGLAGG